MNTENRHGRLREAWVDFIMDQRFTHGLTFHWHAPISEAAARADLSYIHMRVDRELLGPRFHKNPERTEAIFFMEGREATDSYHCHSLWRVAPGHRTLFEPFVLNLNLRHSIWKKIAPAGSIKLLHHGDGNADGKAAAIYNTKELAYRSTDRVIFSSDFIKQHPRGFEAKA